MQTITNNEQIETLFKVEPPLESLEEKGYFGYLGVVLRNKVEDTIQCHICGGWFKHVTNHLKKHQIKPLEYRKKFQLPLNFALCSRELSNKYHTYGVSKENLERIKLWKTKGNIKLLQTKKARTNLVYSLTNTAFLNTYGTCEKQVESRYLVVADTVGREPSKKDLWLHDRALLELIKRRYGNLTTYREKNGFTVPKQYPIRSEESLIAWLREKAKNMRTVPTARVLRKGTPNYATYVRRFGSLRRALAIAGII